MSRGRGRSGRREGGADRAAAAGALRSRAFAGALRSGSAAGPGGGLARNRCGGAPRPPGRAGTSLPFPGHRRGPAGDSRGVGGQSCAGGGGAPEPCPPSSETRPDPAQGHRRGRAVAPGSPLVLLKPPLQGLGMRRG